MTDLRTLSVELELLRTRGARGSSRQRVSLQTLAARTGIPRSTLHAYLRGARIPPADSLDFIVQALGVSGAELGEWADALYRVVAHHRDTRFHAARPADPSDDRPVRPPRQLPPAPRRLVGREHDLRALDTTLSVAASSVVVATGVGGVGKTALVLRWAHDRITEFPDGQIWLDLRGFGPLAPMSTLDALDRLLSAVGVDTAGLDNDVDLRAALFRTHVADKRMLVVLDNVRDAAQVLPLVAGSPNVTTVITSRDALRAVSAAIDVTAISVRPLPHAHALSLLVENQPAEVVTALNNSAIASFCSGLPLTLHIVRDGLGNATGSEIAEWSSRYRAGHNTVAGADSSDASREASVHTTLTWSYDALTPGEQSLFRLLPLCLTTTFDAVTVAIVAGLSLTQVRTLLDRLASVGLLDNDGPGIFRMHDLVALFAWQCLAAATHDDANEARRRLLVHLAEQTASFVASWDSRSPRLVLPPGDESPVALGLPRADSTWVLASADRLRSAVIDAAARPGLQHLACPLAERAARALWPVRDLRFFEPALLAARDSADQSHDIHGSIVTSRHLGLAYSRRGDLDAAGASFGAAVDLAIRHRVVASPVGGPTSDAANLGAVWLLQGRTVQARDLLISTVSAATPNDDLTGCLLTLTDLELQRSRFGRAARHLDDAIGHAESRLELNGATALEALLLSARLHHAMGRDQSALDDVSIVQHAARSSDHKEYLSQALAVAADIALVRIDLEAAKALSDSALDTARAVGARGEEAAALDVAARVASTLNDPDMALELFAGAIAVARQGGLVFCEAVSLVNLGQLELLLGDAEAARTTAERCLLLSAPRGYEGLVRRSMLLLDPQPTEQ